MRDFPAIKTTSNPARRGFLLVAGIIWGLIVATGFTILAREEFTPVPATTISAAFPAKSSLPLASDRPTLVLFLHPQCPCSHATLRELDELLVRIQAKASVEIVFTIPDGVRDGWEKGDLWDMAAKMPGVRVMRDFGGVEAKRFGVNGSGHALLYATSGKRLFSGGITGSRGHEGDNPGCDAIADFVLQGKSAVSQTPVFGCSLL